MRVVLSRKGFDSSYGGMPSPILPDGTLLSLPIPVKDESLRYSDLNYGSETYLDIIKQLKPATRIQDDYTCHLDPDLVEGVTARSSPWRPLFGQCNQSQGHLVDHGIGIGDLFLFFGWFRQTERVDGKLCFARNAPDVHLIWGHMLIQRVSTGIQMPSEYSYHPHGRLTLPTNAIYEGDPAHTAVLKYHPKRALTKSGMSRSKWELPASFRNLTISYHTSSSFKSAYFQSAMRGQEFIIEANKDVDRWARSLIETD